MRTCASQFVARSSWMRSSRWVHFDAAPNPRGRGQSVESQAGSRGTDVRRLPRHRGAVRGGWSARRPGGSPGSGVDVPPTHEHRRNRDVAQTATRHARPARAGRRGDGLRNGRGQGTGISRRLRRIRREADQRAGAARPDRGIPRRTGGLMDIGATVLAVDDQPTNLRLLDAVLTPRGHCVLTAASGAEALALLETEDIDIVLLDILMPEMNGYEVCRRIRSNPATEFLPVVMITASGSEQRLAALEAGADDFVTKPFDKSELLARVASLARIKRYHDTIRRQADELAKWNTELESRVAEQVAELERANRLRRFLSPQLADLVIGDETLLESHRREIVVLFTDLRNFTPFAETSEPEEVMGVLREYHRVIGTLVHEYGGTLERFTGDGVMVFFNDPIQYDDAAERAVRMALEIQEAVKDLAAQWLRKGHDLALGIGIAQNFATLGRIGFEGRFDYAAIGSVTNLAARLCADAGPWQVLVTDRVLAPIERIAVSEMVGDVQPKGFSRSVRVHNIKALDEKNEE